MKNQLPQHLALVDALAEQLNISNDSVSIRQIYYYRESHVFKSKQDIETVYKCLEKLVDRIELQIEYEYKFRYGGPTQSDKIKYSVYINEFCFGR